MNAIYGQLSKSNEKDKDLLCEWIRTITHSTRISSEQWTGNRDMIDLRDLVLKYYYSPLTNGSNSIKQVLPAILNSSDYLKDKYSRPIYGDIIKSLNFSKHQWVWIDEKNNTVKNPYETLPKIHEGISNELLDDFLLDEEAGIYDGGLQ